MDLAACFKKCISLMDVLAHLIGCIIKGESKLLYISKPTDFCSILENYILHSESKKLLALKSFIMYESLLGS